MFPVSQPLTDDTLLELCFAVALPAIASGIVFNIRGMHRRHRDRGDDPAPVHRGGDGQGSAAQRYRHGAVCGFTSTARRPGCTACWDSSGAAPVVDTAIESLNLRKVCTVIRLQDRDPVRRLRYGNTGTHGHPAERHRRVHRRAPHHDHGGIKAPRRQAGLLRDFLRREDPEAFLTIVNSSEIIGKGFQSI